MYRILVQLFSQNCILEAPHAVCQLYIVFGCIRAPFHFAKEVRSVRILWRSVVFLAWFIQKDLSDRVHLAADFEVERAVKGQATAGVWKLNSTQITETRVRNDR